MAILLFLFGFPLVAFINSYIFNTIFQRYMPKDQEEQDGGSLKPILEDVRLSAPSEPLAMPADEDSENEEAKAPEQKGTPGSNF